MIKKFSILLLLIMLSSQVCATTIAGNDFFLLFSKSKIRSDGVNYNAERNWSLQDSISNQFRFAELYDNIHYNIYDISFTGSTTNEESAIEKSNTSELFIKGLTTNRGIIPEPSTMILLSCGFWGLAWFIYNRKKA